MILYYDPLCCFIAALPGFYLRKKVAGSTLKIQGSIFGAKPRMRGPNARAGGEPERGCPPSWWGGLVGHPRENFENCIMIMLSGDHFCSSIQESDSLSICLENYM